MRYQTTVSQIWRHHPLDKARQDYAQLVRYATLAASSHNTQPWKFQLDPGRVSILPDWDRRCAEVDPDDHHLYASLGCAAANLLEAASAAGLRGNVTFDESSSAVRVDLEDAPASRSVLFDAIPKRQCSRAAYDGSPATQEELRSLESAGCGKEVSVRILTGKDEKQEVVSFVTEGNRAQMEDRRWVDELKAWTRFNGRHAVRTGDGLYGPSVGSPAVPKWLGRMILPFVLSPKTQSRKDERNILSSAGIAVFVSELDDRAHWVEAGRCYERFALQAAALGMRTAFVNQPVEVPRIRSQLASWLDLRGGRPDLVVRFGRGPEMPRSLRRPVEQVIVGAESAL